MAVSMAATSLLLEDREEPHEANVLESDPLKLEGEKMNYPCREVVFVDGYEESEICGSPLQRKAEGRRMQSFLASGRLLPNRRRKMQPVSEKSEASSAKQIPAALSREMPMRLLRVCAA